MHLCAHEINPACAAGNLLKPSILQLCCFSNLWPSCYQVTSIDLKNNQNVLSLPDDYGKQFDLIVSAPPCTQFTKANSLSWSSYPDYYIKVARKCLTLSIKSDKPWFLENPPGRIERFIPELKDYRIATWHGNTTNKEYIIYSNLLFLFNYTTRYGKPGSVSNYSKKHKELWQENFIQSLMFTIQQALLPVGLSSACRTQ